MGDRVVCCLHAPKYGGYAEYAACDVTCLVPLSSKLSYSQGAAIYVPYFTAYKALLTRYVLRLAEIIDLKK